MANPSVPQRVAPPIEAAFRRLREELEIRSAFPPEVMREAERVAKERIPAPDATRPDRTDVPFVTIDPPGSRDLDQAVHAERAGDGYRLRYAIADVGFWIDRGGAIEREAWLRGVTFYAPDCRDPLYPAVLSQGAASLLPGESRPAIVFEFELDASAALVKWEAARAIVRSVAQLTYTDLLEHGAPADGPGGAADPGFATLALIGEIGPKLLALEAARGGVSLPVRDQHVQRQAASRLGYELEYEAPNEAESWNAEISLLTGHVAAERMLQGGIGVLRTMPPFQEKEVARFRRAAQTLGFPWPADMSYAEFMHRVDARNPRIDVLVRQARHVMHGADYVFFQGAPPEQPLHGALAFTYAHATAPLRRLADRYVLDLVMTLGEGRTPADAEVDELRRLPDVMNAASRKEGLLERRMVDLAEAWSLRDRVGVVLPGVVIDRERGTLEVQVEDPPIRALIEEAARPHEELGARVGVRVDGADVEKGRLQLSLANAAGDSPVTSRDSSAA